MGRFVRPEILTVPISQGDTLVVKKRLNAGERRAMFAAMSDATASAASGALRLNHLQVGMATILAYLLDWSLRDDDGRPVVIRDQPRQVVEAALDALDPESFGEILKAIEDHEKAMTLEREAEKNARDGETGLPATSPSLVAVAGATSG